MSYTTNTFKAIRSKISPALILTLAFFAGLVYLGFRIYQDYGVGWDEPAQYKIAFTNYLYVFKHSASLFSLKNRYYGAIYELALLYLTKNADLRQMYLGRHLFNYLFFVAGVAGFFFLARRLFSNNWLALLTSLCLVLSPRIFGDSFNNTKDIPFMVVYIFAMLTLFFFLSRPSLLSAFLHAGVGALLVAMRVPGIFIPAVTLTFLIGGWIFQRRTAKEIRNEALLTAFYLALTAGFVVLFWPILWHNPLGEFITAFRTMSRFPWNNPVLFIGTQYLAANLPWFYLPVWIAISTPLIYLGSFIVGSIAMLAGLFRRSGNWFEGEKRNALVLLACFFGPLVAILIAHPTIYDAWRQVFFIYPALLLIAVQGMRLGYRCLNRFLPGRYAAVIGAAILTLGLLEPAVFMLRNHPNEYVYFNRLAAVNMAQIGKLYETDYAGLAYKQGIDYVLATDPSMVIPIRIDKVPGVNYINDLLPASEQKRLDIQGDVRDARYYVADYRFHPGDYPFTHEVFSVKVDGVTILSVFDLRGEPGNASQ